MIRKWQIRMIVYLLITVFLAVVAFYLYNSVVKTNSDMERLRTEGERYNVTMKELDQINYVGEGSFSWGYVVYVDGEEVKGATTTRYTVAQAKEMNKTVEVCVIKLDDGTVLTYDSNYVDKFRPWTPSQGIVLWILAGITFAVAMSYLGRNLFFIYILKKGEESLGRFEEAFHPKFGSSRYYQIKYTFVRDGETVTVVSPAYYDGKEADKLHDYGQFVVRYKGKHSVIDQKL